MNKTIKCIACPIGCDISVDFNEETKEIISFSGNECQRGARFIKEEIKSPARLLTTTIQTDSKDHPRIPVRSSVPVPKEKIMEMVREVKKIKVELPVRSGQVLFKNIMDTGADIISSAAFTR